MGGSVYTTEVLTPDIMTCPFCDKHEQSMDELQTHIVSHLSTLPKVKKMNSQGPSWSMDMAVDSEAKKPRIQEDKKYQDITALIARSVLVQDMTLRELVGGVMHTFVIEKDHSVTTAMKQAGDSYFAKTIGKNRRTPTGTSSHSRLPSDVAGSDGKARHRWSALEVERDVGLYIQHTGNSLRDSESMQAHESVQEHGHEDLDLHSPHGGGIAGQSTGEGGSEASRRPGPPQEDWQETSRSGLIHKPQSERPWLTWTIMRAIQCDQADDCNRLKQL